MAVGIRIAEFPVEIIISERVLASELAVVRGSATVVVFCASLQVGLCAHTVTPCIAASGKLVEDVLQLVLVVAVLREQCEVEHRAKSYVVVVLVVNGVTQVVRLVVHRIINAIEVVLHVCVCAVLVGVVDSSEQSESSVPDIVTTVEASCDLEVSKRFLGLHEPVVVEFVAEE